jgi:uncharacterized protein (TIGR03437 family)
VDDRAKRPSLAAFLIYNINHQICFYYFWVSFEAATLQVVAGVGNVGAEVLYAGQAPYLMAGVAQINIVIPADTSTGVVPLALLVDGVFSPPGVTIAVK